MIILVVLIVSGVKLSIDRFRHPFSALRTTVSSINFQIYGSSNVLTNQFTKRRKKKPAKSSGKLAAMKMGGGGSKVHDPVRDGESAAPTTP